jgi:hypothetical protein
MQNLYAEQLESYLRMPLKLSNDISRASSEDLEIEAHCNALYQLKFMEMSRKSTPFKDRMLQWCTLYKRGFIPHRAFCYLSAVAAVKLPPQSELPPSDISPGELDSDGELIDMLLRWGMPDEVAETALLCHSENREKSEAIAVLLHGGAMWCHRAGEFN